MDRISVRADEDMANNKQYPERVLKSKNSH